MSEKCARNRENPPVNPRKAARTERKHESILKDLFYCAVIKSKLCRKNTPNNLELVEEKEGRAAWAEMRLLLRL